MGLFDKKYCDICGEKIGLLGNRKLSDGNLCKDCAAKLSPWFTERKQSTVEEIREQLRLREENRQKLADFHPTRTIGVDTKVYVDEPGKTFIVTGAQDIMKANPNLIRMDQVADCQMDIRHTRTELKRENAQGEKVSYDPPVYEYDYTFWMEISSSFPMANNSLTNRASLCSRELILAPLLAVHSKSHFGKMGSIEKVLVFKSTPHSARPVPQFYNIHICVDQHRVAGLNAVKSADKVQKRLLARSGVLLLIQRNLLITIAPSAHEVNQPVARGQQRHHRVEVRVVVLQVVHQLARVFVARDLRANHRHCLRQPARRHALPGEATHYEA